MQPHLHQAHPAAQRRHFEAVHRQAGAVASGRTRRLQRCAAGTQQLHEASLCPQVLTAL
jgi:hypothetical protein